MKDILRGVLLGIIFVAFCVVGAFLTVELARRQWEHNENVTSTITVQPGQVWCYTSQDPWNIELHRYRVLEVKGGGCGISS